MDINKFVFLDFETDTKGEIFCATIQVGSTIEQIILNESLRPLAEEKKLKTLTPLEFVKDLETLLQKKTLAAYSEAEYKTIKQVLESANKKLTQIQYCNMRTITKKYINSNPELKKKFDSLPPFFMGADDYRQKRMQWSLASTARLFPVTIPAHYHPGQTSQRFKTVINALELRNGEYSSLTPTQKSKATKALKHNLFDVEVLPIIFTKILENNPNLLNRNIETKE